MAREFCQVRWGPASYPGIRMGHPVDAATPGEPPSWRRGATPWLLGVLAVGIVAGAVGDTASPVLIVHTPLLLVLLNPRARNVLLASRTVGAIPLVTLTLLRRMIAVPVCHRLGVIHGDASLAWIERRFPRSGRWARRVERWFDRGAVPVVLLLPGVLTSYLAGSTAMSATLLVVLSALSWLVRLAILLAVGNAFSGPITWLLHFIADHQRPLLAISILIAAVQLVRFGLRLRRAPVEGVELL